MRVTHIAGVGPYDQLYASSKGHVLWSGGPGRLVARIAEFCPPGRVLDAGCGDGKNALYLEQHGFSVVGIDISALALMGLRRRFNDAGCHPTGQYLLGDLCDPLLPELGFFDVLVSYGLFHCLPVEERLQAHQRLQRRVHKGGVMLLAALTEEIPVTAAHRTPEVSLASKAELAGLLHGWKVTECDEAIIVESHPPIVGTHRHSVAWIVAERSD